MEQHVPVAEALAEQRGCGVVAYDWLGCGRSAKPEDWKAYDCDELLEDLAAVHDQFCTKSGSASSFIVGHSYGVHLVCQLALRLQTSGHTPTGLILMGGALTVPEGHPIFRLPVRLLDRLQPSLTTSFLRLALAPGADPELVADQEAACNSNPMYMCKAYYRQMRNADAHGISRLTAPTLVIHGEVDGVLPVAGAVALAKAIPTAGEPVIVPAASHNVMLEQPAEVARHIARFIAEHDVVPTF